MTTQADILIAYAKTFIGRPYGEGTAATQRGPTSYDCIGFVLRTTWDKGLASQVGITANTWTVPDFVRTCPKPKIALAQARAGDIIVFGPSINDTQHIGLLVDSDHVNYLSALAPGYGVCMYPIAKTGYPVAAIYSTGFADQIVEALKMLAPTMFPKIVSGSVYGNQDNFNINGDGASMAAVTGHTIASTGSGTSFDGYLSYNGNNYAHVSPTAAPNGIQDYFLLSSGDATAAMQGRATIHGGLAAAIAGGTPVVVPPVVVPPVVVPPVVVPPVVVPPTVDQLANVRTAAAALNTALAAVATAQAALNAAIAAV